MRYMSGSSQPLRYQVKGAYVSARVVLPYIASHCRDSTGSARVQHGLSLLYGAVSPRLQGQSCFSAQPRPPAPEANPQEVR